MHYYSPETCGFYRSDIHSSIPADAVEISAAEHRHLMDELSSGKMINVDGSRVQAVNAPPPTDEELARQLRIQRDRLLADCDYILMPDYPLSAALRAAWAAYRQQLRDLPETITDPLAIDWPQSPAEG